MSAPTLDTDAQWRCAVYRLYAGDRPVGSAFGIGPRLALTCHHCVSGGEAAMFGLHGHTTDGRMIVIDVAEVVLSPYPTSQDLAIVRVDRDLPAWLPLIASRPDQYGDLAGYGFPGFNAGQPVVRIDTVSRGIQATSYASGSYTLRDAILLGGDTATFGMSGGPLIDLETGGAVGVIVGGADYINRAIALPLWAVSHVDRPWTVFAHAVAWPAYDPFRVRRVHGGVEAADGR